ncbi:MAG: hypothetical protein GX115_01455 [Ruminiclostridium sp.]|nr:hypothetical protein [Ruminiclostridium sp.]
MQGYFPKEESIYTRCEDNVRDVMRVIANRYIGDNPAYPFVLRAFSKDGFKQLKDGRYDLNLDDKYPEAQLGKAASLFAMLWSDDECETIISISFRSPTSLYVNGKLQCRSSIEEERYQNKCKHIKLLLVKGWNSFLIKTRKSPTGFGCVIGSTSGKWSPMHFMSPFTERYGQGGWIYSALTDAQPDVETITADVSLAEADTGLQWYPALDWDEGEKEKAVFSRIFSDYSGQTAYGWTRLFIPSERCDCSVEGETFGPVEIWIDQQKVFSAGEAGLVRFQVTLSYGAHDVLVESQKGSEMWGFQLQAMEKDHQIPFKTPCIVRGSQDQWMYLGPFDAPLQLQPVEITNGYRLFKNNGNGVYWCLDKPGFRVRPYLENRLYAKWHYHLGVTLYGLLRTGKLLDREDILCYALSHAAECVGIYDYSLYDRDEYGFQSINHQLVEMDALDDCGSFGAAVIALYQETDFKKLLPIIEIIADYIHNRQIRTEDGAFRRGDETMWADDLYMGTPFLAKYYQLTGKQEYIDDAANQFLLFKKYLFIPEHRVMSHVYDFRHGTPTFVPWGRGNGWVLFSLSEVLELLPQDHHQRTQLLEFYRELCEGYLKLQGQNGLWHQVLTDPESYEETSCTAMFTYAFAKGVRHGWMSDVQPYINAVSRAWEGIGTVSVDIHGNVYGVCRGSNFSYNPLYYKYDLLPIKNDTHGIGIILLAGDEPVKMTVWLKNR